MKRYKTLILDDKTIRGLIGIKESVKAVEKAFRYYGEGKAQMPSKVYLHLDKYNGDFRAMPAYIEGFKGCCLKWVNVHPENKRKKLPTVMAILILSDPTNGFPLCIMDATYATALRTGAGGGVAAKYLARDNSRIVALVGCGEQAKTQFLALNELFNIEQVKIWGRHRHKAMRFIKDMRKLKRINTEVSDTIENCVRDSDIIVTTTSSRKPLVKLEWLKDNVHINAIGADAKGKRELDSRILKKAKIVIDSWDQASHSGEISVPLQRGELSKSDIYADLGEIVTGKKKARTKNTGITVFDSTGLAIQDVAIANIIYKKALKLKNKKFINLCKHR